MDVASTANQKQALIRLGAYQMLARANFDVSPVEKELSKDKQLCSFISGEEEILFSPYQTLEYEVANVALHITANIDGKKSNSVQHVKRYAEYQKRLNINEALQNVSLVKKIKLKNSLETEEVSAFVNHVTKLYAKEKNIEKLSKMIVSEHSKDKKTEFYPLVETLFRIIGVDCYKSRDGVNGERWDAMIRDSSRSIPIEIKSPTEELHISLKAIRQALENKIILLSRKTYITDKETSSYAVGYFPPNERAEVLDLISDIKLTYGYKIAVFDIETLIRIATNIILFEKGIDIERLYGLEGIVNVTEIEG